MPDGSNAALAPWQSVDGILVVNMDESTERWKEFRRVNAAHLPMEKVERLSAVCGVKLPGFRQAPWFTERTGKRSSYWAGCAGCTLSHRRAIAYAKEKAWRNVLIMEDDIVVAPQLGSVLDACLPKLSGSFFLYGGYSRPIPYGRKVMEVEHAALWQVEGVLSTFGYVVSEELYDVLLEKLPQEKDVWRWLSLNRAVDTFYRDFISTLKGVRTYILHPDAILVKDGYSEIAHKFCAADRFIAERPPHSFASIKGICRRLFTPLRRLKVRLNAWRTYRRAITGGFPGYRKKRPKS